MFSKKPRRNFRQRKASSSDEEDQQKISGDGEETEKASVVVQKLPKLAQGRGITCRSKKPDSSDEERGGEDEERPEVTAGKEAKRKDKDRGNEKSTTALSFSDDREGNDRSLIAWERMSSQRSAVVPPRVTVYFIMTTSLGNCAVFCGCYT